MTEVTIDIEDLRGLVEADRGDGNYGCIGEYYGCFASPCVVLCPFKDLCEEIANQLKKED